MDKIRTFVFVISFLFFFFFIPAAFAAELNTTPVPIFKNNTFQFTIKGDIDLSDAKIVKAIHSISSGWTLSRWSVDIPQKWWDTYQWKLPIHVSLQSPLLTEYKPGGFFTINKPGLYEFTPRVDVEIIDKSTTTHSPFITFKGYSSHRDVVLYILINSKENITILPIRPLIKKDGSFEFQTKKLIEGKNRVMVLYSRMLDKPQVATDVTITYTPTLLARIQKYVLARYTAFKNAIFPSQKPAIGTPPSVFPTSTIYLSPSESTKKWLLAAGGILSAQNREGFDTLKCAIPVSDIKTLILRDWWGVTDRKTALSTLDWLENGGQRSDFEHTQKMIEMTTQGNKDSYDELRDSLIEQKFANNESIFAFDFVFNHLYDLKKQSLAAWDFVRVINISRWSFSAGYISEDEAWMHMLSAGKRVQKTYSSWDDMAKHYVYGRTFWAQTNNHPETMTFINWLQKSPGSPWRNISWSQPLP